MTNKPLLWMLASGTFALLAVVAYLIFALTLADHMKSDLVPQDKAAAYVHALIEAGRTSSTKHVVDTLHKAGFADTIEHRRPVTTNVLTARAATTTSAM